MVSAGTNDGDRYHRFEEKRRFLDVTIADENDKIFTTRFILKVKQYPHRIR